MSGRLSILLGLFLAALAGPVLAQPVKVVASFSILGDMIRQVGGDQVKVTVLVGPDSDAHVYQPTPADAKAMAEADLIVINGLGFEGWMSRLIKSSGAKSPVTVAATGAKTQSMQSGPDKGHHGHKHGKATDPHAWQNLANGQIYVANIVKALSAVAPDRADTFRAAGERYTRRLSDLDVWVRTTLAEIPRENRKAISSHDAFGYFATAYDITFIAPIGGSTDAEPTAKSVAAIIKQIRTEKVRALFVENMSNPRLIQQIAREANGIVGDKLFSDALSPPDGPAPTYEAMFRHNTGALKTALMAGN